MSSYLFITLYRCCPLVEVQTAEDGILPEALLDGRHNFIEI